MPIPRSTIRLAASIDSTSSTTFGTSPARRNKPSVSVQSLEPRSKRISGWPAISSRRARPTRAIGLPGVATSISGSSRRLTVSISGCWSERASPSSASPDSTMSSTSLEWPERTVILVLGWAA